MTLGSSKTTVAYTFSQSFWYLAQAAHMAYEAWQEPGHGLAEHDRLSGISSALQSVVRAAVRPGSLFALRESIAVMQEQFEKFPTDDQYAQGYLEGLAQAVVALDYTKGR